jgi:hypothetical protein
MPDNEIWYTGKNKKKDMIKLECLAAYRKCRTTGGRLLGNYQEKLQWYDAGFKKVFHGTRSSEQHC